MNKLLKYISGITPAYAGNTELSSAKPPELRDHPRLRGEHLQLVLLGRLCKGSPPPTRGTPLEIDFTSLDDRITPAYAGNTNNIITVQIFL